MSQTNITTIAQRKDYLETLFGVEIRYQAGLGYFVATANRYVNISKVNEQVKELGLQVHSVNIHDGGKLTILLGAV